MNPSPKTINDSAHFKVFAPTATRRLIDRARKSIAREEPLGERAEFEDAHQPPLDDGAGAIEQAMQVARLGKAMHEAEVDDPRADRIIKLKNGGLTNEEIVEAAGVDVSVVKRDWRAARLSRLSIGIETGLNRTRRDNPAKFFFSSMNRSRPAACGY